MAARQRGLVTRAQLLGAGLTADEIAGRLRAGRLHAVHRGVYAVGHPALAPPAAEQAALLACGPGSVLSHLTAAVLWELLPAAGLTIHVTVTGGRVPRPPAGVRLHRADALEPARREGLPVTTPARTLLDLAATAKAPQLARALNEAQIRRLISVDALSSAAAGRRGARALRTALEDHHGYTRSRAERQLLALLKRAELPRPRTNVPLEGFEVDAHWPEARLVVEVDAYGTHGSRTAFERDRLRDARLQAAGFRVLRITWNQLNETPEAVVAALAPWLCGRPPG
ncbi:MAG: hypothetical protein AVDCRST_MAG30-510 [uncultured Solirubrobacteraceae bacterium]|uniref:DUF559 domain-containing protein n=1 Tax=uncultured Solirubrobacteraceae bacterium TaxID=1162706 RepID=A0A6J4RQE4_9ACTN|nr:MAG: hypothetical protein AVDCRST_MAG30-510 [uncultured Solirubrobacteraceae bacterium]